MRQIAVLGCGWLGLPLAKAFLAQGFAVNGSTTTYHKLEVLKNAGIGAYRVALGDSSFAHEVQDFLLGSEILIINIPPKVKAEGSDSYPEKIKALLPFIERAGIKKVLFVSSTSVYADDNSNVTEATPAHPETESGKQVLQAEQLLQANPNFSTTIVRFGALTGAGREPVKHLAGRDNVANPNAPINLIGQQDCMGIITAIIQKEAWGELFNGVAPLHTTREKYYTQRAEVLGLPLPRFNHEAPSAGKRVMANKVIQVLGYTFE